MKETILIADDSRNSAKLLSRKLQANGYDTIEGYDGKQTLKLTLEKLPELILLDVMMPELDGFRVCQILKADQVTKNIPIIMLTAKEEIDDKVKGLDLGADDYLTKPYDFEELLARIKSLLKAKSDHRKQIEKEKANALDRLVEEMAHEVRNPVVSIGGFARRLYEGLSDEDPKKQYAQIILKETERLERMINEISNVNMLPRGEKTEQDLHVLLEEALEEVDSMLADKEIKVIRAFFSDVPMIKANRQSMIMAFTQVITNAIEAMDKGGILRITTSRSDRHDAAVEIDDNGRGIAEKDLGNVFLPFFTSKITSAGMGLALVRKIIHDHQGAIDIRSKPNESTKVYIQIPGSSIV